jgi:hypothetical protein
MREVRGLGSGHCMLAVPELTIPSSCCVSWFATALLVVLLLLVHCGDGVCCARTGSAWPDCAMSTGMPLHLHDSIDRLMACDVEHAGLKCMQPMSVAGVTKPGRPVQGRCRITEGNLRALSYLA